MNDVDYEKKLAEDKIKIKDLKKKHPEFCFFIVEKRGLLYNPYNLIKDIISYLEWEYEKCMELLQEEGKNNAD